MENIQLILNYIRMGLAGGIMVLATFMIVMAVACIFMGENKVKNIVK